MRPMTTQQPEPLDERTQVRIQVIERFMRDLATILDVTGLSISCRRTSCMISLVDSNDEYCFGVGATLTEPRQIRLWRYADYDHRRLRRHYL
jgi:hypothetical protein